MFTEKSLRQHPAVIKAFMGLPAAAFWELIERIKEQLPAYEAQRLARADRGQTLRSDASGCVARTAPPAARAPGRPPLPGSLAATGRGSRP